MNTKEHIAIIPSPIGSLRISAGPKGLRSISVLTVPAKTATAIPAECRDAVRALQKYFEGAENPFSGLTLDAEGTDFEKLVWKALSKVKNGSVTTYGELAAQVGHPGAARAVGSAMRKNPLPIIVPCHRVLAAGATREEPGEYACGTAKKKWLLQHEAKK
jgi:methylated-DNA-[protein]-cysteine S-methyltransferase